MLVVALLMVSRLPTYSIKRVRIPHRHVMAALLVFGLLAALLVSIPWLTLLGVGVVYVGSMPVAVIAHRRLTVQQPPRTPARHRRAAGSDGELTARASSPHV